MAQLSCDRLGYPEPRYGFSAGVVPSGSTLLTGKHSESPEDSESPKDSESSKHGGNSSPDDPPADQDGGDVGLLKSSGSASPQKPKMAVQTNKWGIYDPGRAAVYYETSES